MPCEVQQVKVVFLCGGSGKRMFPITEDKFLLKFLGKTLLEHQLERAKEAGISDFVIVANQQSLKMVEGIASNIGGANVEIALQTSPLGIADALRSAGSFLNGEIIVVNPNDVFDGGAYTDLMEARRNDSASSYLLGYRVNDYFPGGYLVVDSRNNLKLIAEKPGRGSEPSNLVNILVHLHTDPGRLLRLAGDIESATDDVYERAIDALARDGGRVKVVPYAGSWAPVKYPWHILDVVRLLLDESEGGVSSSARISEKATLEGKVVMGSNVRVFENAVIRGPAYIGPNSVIGNSALIRPYSHIGADCVVGYSTEVKASYTGDGCWFHMSYVGDSIIADGCSFGAGTVLANFRFDEATIKVRIQDEVVDSGRDKLGAIIGSGSKTGVNASVMPGIRIGPNSSVGSGMCLGRDLEPGKLVLAEPTYTIIPNPTGLEDEQESKARERLEELQCAE